MSKKAFQERKPFPDMAGGLFEDPYAQKSLPSKNKTFEHPVDRVVRESLHPVNHVRQIIEGVVPSKSNCYRIIILKNKDKTKQHASLAKSQELKLYEKSFAFQCNGYRNKNIDTDFKIEVDVFYPSRRADLDNSLKVLLDCLQQAHAIVNDNKCVEIHARRFVDALNPRVEFVITKL